MKRYFVRSIKYLLLLSVIYLAVMALMYHTGSLGFPYVEGFWESLKLQLFATERGRLLIPALVVLALFYPRFGFVKRTVLPCRMEEHRQQIENAFTCYGYVLYREEEEEWIFRCEGWLARLGYLFEDEIHLRSKGEGIEIEGIRRAAVKIAYRLEGFLSHIRS